MSLQIFTGNRSWRQLYSLTQAVCLPRSNRPTIHHPREASGKALVDAINELRLQQHLARSTHAVEEQDYPDRVGRAQGASKRDLQLNTAYRGHTSIPPPCDLPCKTLIPDSGTIDSTTATTVRL